MANRVSLKQGRYNTFTMILPVFNEEARVERVVEYYRGFAPLIVVDNYSTDGTVAMLEKLGVKYVQYKNPGTTQTPECMRYFSTLTGTDYVLFLACSEFIPAALIEKFDEVARLRSHDVVSCVRDSYTCGELIPLWGGRFKGTDARVERFFNIHALDLDKVVIHGHFAPLKPERLLHLPQDRHYRISHLRDADADSLIRKAMEYARVEVQHRERRGRILTIPKLIALFFKEMVRFIHIGPSHWNMIACREIWARLVMHSLNYWLGWEQRTGMTIGHSREQNERLWQKLVLSKKEKGI